MRKIVLAVMLALSVAACASLPVATRNPVTKQMLYEAESGAVVVFAALNAYRKTCNSGVIPVTCKDTLAKIRVVTKQIPGYLKLTRNFVRNNDQVNAYTAYSTLMALIAQAKTETP